MALLCGSIAGMGCDVGPRETLDPRGARVRLLATYPKDGAGLSCTPDSPADCGVPLDAPIELRFDRFLLPSTVVRQSLRASTADSEVFLQPRYDAVERVVVLRVVNGGIWLPGTRYIVRLKLPDDDPNGWGFRAFDGAPLAKDGRAPIEFTFRTRRDYTPQHPPAPTADWNDMQTVIERGGCTASGCHGSSVSSMGLDLRSAASVEDTAVNEVAHQAESEPNAMEPREDAVRFGTQMPLVDPGRPGNSYLFYKLLVNPESYTGACESQHSVALDGCVAFPKEQTDELRAWFVRGRPMPLPTGDEPGHLSLDDIRTVQSWIAADAPLK